MLIIAGSSWIVTILAAPRESGGITLPGMFDGDPVEHLHRPAACGARSAAASSRTLQAAAVAAVGAIVLGFVLSLMRSSDRLGARCPTAWLIEFLRGMPVLLHDAASSCSVALDRRRSGRS